MFKLSVKGYLVILKLSFLFFLLYDIGAESFVIAQKIKEKAFFLLMSFKYFLD